VFNELIYSSVRNGTLFFINKNDKCFMILDRDFNSFPKVIHNKKAINNFISDCGFSLSDIKQAEKIETSGNTSVYFIDA